MEITQQDQQKKKNFKKWEQFKRSLKKHQSHQNQNTHYTGPRKRKEREQDQKRTWWNYSWKLSKPEEGTESMEGPKQVEPK